MEKYYQECRGSAEQVILNYVTYFKHRQVTIKIKRYNVICGGNPQISSLIHCKDLFVILVMHVFVERGI